MRISPTHERARTRAHKRAPSLTLAHACTPPPPQALDVKLLDNVVKVCYDASNPQRLRAEQLMLAFKEHPEAWTRVDTILEQSSNPNTKYLALQVRVGSAHGEGQRSPRSARHRQPLHSHPAHLQILEALIKYRWKTLPPEQREGIRTYLVQKIIAVRAAQAAPACGCCSRVWH